MSDQWQQPASAWPSNSGEPIVNVVAGEAPAITQEQRNEAIKGWLGDKAKAEAAVEVERAMRATLTTMLFPNPTKGTQRYVSPEGFGAIKLVFGWTYTLGDKDKIDPSTGLKVPISDQVDAVLEEIEALGERGVLLADRLVKWKPELSPSEYELLAASADPVDIEIKTLIDAI
jgi:plasmid stabilization system protein ParE